MISRHCQELERIHALTLGNGVATLAVTAANPGEGCSTLVLALARRNLLAGKSTLVVDLNLHAPMMEPALPLEDRAERRPLLAAPGLVSYSGDDQVYTGITAPSGRAVVMRLSEPGVLEGQIEQWRGTFDTVLIDTPPVNHVNGRNIPAERICAACEGALLVVLAGYTTEPMVHSAAEKLGQAGARLVGTVLNDRDNPPLRDELLREASRLEPLWPRLAAWLKRLIGRNRFLAIEI